VIVERSPPFFNLFTGHNTKPRKKHEEPYPRRTEAIRGYPRHAAVVTQVD
jgi:hypothetical protein